MKHVKYDKISIGFICYEFPMGGVEKNIIDIGNYLSDNGLNVYVICETFAQNSYPATKDCKFKVMEMGEDSFKTPEAMAYTIVNFIKDNNLHLDIFVCHVYNDYFKFIKQKLGCKFIFTLQCMPFAEVRTWLERKKDKKGLINKIKYISTKLFIKNILYYKFRDKFVSRYREIYNIADAYTCLCNAYKEELTKAMGIAEENSKIKVIYNFEDVPENFSYSQRDKVILYVGRLFNSDKRVDRLLRIWKDTQDNIPEWKLVIAGDGPDRGFLENLSKELGLKRISFLGWVNNSRELMKKASILCLTSESEGWPLVLMEAQAIGLPAIAFDCSAGVYEILSPSGINGVIVPHRNERKFSKALIELAKDRQKREKIAFNAYNAVKRFSIEYSGSKWLDLINSLIYGDN
ncbi:MAG: glycosyltransferase [Bacteroidia bacterium]|nr:glycosyltransferase [Bacteroidia bacterium]